MKNHTTTRKLTSLLTAFAASAACLPTVLTVPQTAVAADDTDNYAKLLQYSMYLYDGNMCGADVEQKSAFSWRGNCHTDDKVPGGYHDCGDHVKFGITAGYSAATLGWSYYEYGSVFDKLGQTGHLKLITDHFAKYFRDCTTLSGDTVTEFVYQIGDGGADHNSYWGPPEEQDSSSRKVFSTSNGASDIAAEYAAALAVNYINFHNEEDLKYAKALWDFSCKGNQVATEGTGGFYDSKDYKDDQSFAAGWLYLATNDDKYNTFLKANQDDPNWEYCWNNVYLGASVLNGEINGDWSIAEKYASQRMSDPSKWYTPDGWGAARYNTAAQFIGLLLTKYKKADYSKWAQGQMNMILGDNTKNVCLVVGYNDKSAKYPHHEAASGLKGWDEYNAAGTTFGPKGGHVLTGALEGGFADASFKYVDALNDITSSEVGIDYNATLVAAAAGLYDIYGTGSIDAKVNGVDRDIKYDAPVSQETTTAAETTSAETTTTTATTSTTNPNRAVRLVTVHIVDEETGEQIPDVEYSIEGMGDNGAFFGSKKFTSTDKVQTHDVNYHDSEDLSAAKHWEISINNVPKEYLFPTPLNSSFFFDENGKAEVTVKIPHAPDYSKITFNIDLTDSATGKAVPGVEFTISGWQSKGWQGEPNLGTKTYTSGDSTNSIDLTWDNVTDAQHTFWKMTITSVPEGYKMPEGENKEVSFVFQTLNTVSAKRQLESTGAPTTTSATTTITTSSAAETTTTVSAEPQTSTSTQNDRLWGDANCDNKVTIADAVAILQSIGNKDKYALKSEGALNADIFNNGDGVTGNDALYIQKMDAGEYKQTDFPISFKK